jgi:hypothetical protein
MISTLNDLKEQSMLSQRIGYASWASIERQFLYLENPKVACSKIKETLQLLVGKQIPEPRHAIHLRKKPAEFVDSLETLRTKDADYCLSSDNVFRFTFVRNPYDRIWSAYKSKILSNDTQFEGFRKTIRQKNPNFYQHGEAITFMDFCRFICFQADAYRDAHWRLQKTVIYADFIDYSYIGRFEYFSHDFRFVLRKLGAPSDLLKAIQYKTNPTKRMQAPYNRELSSMVYEAFKDDFEGFGYPADSWTSVG